MAELNSITEKEFRKHLASIKPVGGAKSGPLYLSRIFFQGEEAVPWLDMLDDHGEEYTVKQILSNTTEPPDPFVSRDKPYGEEDMFQIFDHGSYSFVLTWNHRRGYIGLTIRLN